MTVQSTGVCDESRILSALYEHVEPQAADMGNVPERQAEGTGGGEWLT